MTTVPKLPEHSSPPEGIQIQIPQQPKVHTPAKGSTVPTLWSAIGPDKSKLLIEPEFHAEYDDYVKSRTPESADKLLKKLSPVIDESLRSYGGSEAQTATARAQAKKLALEAVRRYDPERAKLKTHLLSHLRGIRRPIERSSAGVYVPEQWRLDAQRAHGVMEDLREDLGREPSEAELATKLNIPLDRIRRALTVPNTMASSQFEGSVEGSGGTSQKAWDQWVEGIYHDLHPVDQVILEHSFGLHGKEITPANVLAKLVNLSPGAISQRKARIQQMLDEFESFMGR